MKVSVKQNTKRLVKIIEGDRWISFEFMNGEMISTARSMPFKKTRSDWEFYYKAIKRMLSISKDFYADQKRLPIERPTMHVNCKLDLGSIPF